MTLVYTKFTFQFLIISFQYVCLELKLIDRDYTLH